MRKTVEISTRAALAVCMALVVAMTIAAAPVFGAEALKVGLVDLQRAMNESEYGKNAKLELEGFVRERSEKIEGMLKERDRLKEDLDQKRMMMSEDAVKARIEELKKMEREAEKLYNESQEELQATQKKKEIAILKELDDIIEKIGKEGGYALIVPAEAVLYSRDGADLTAEVIRRFNDLKGLAPRKQEPKKPDSRQDKKKP